MEATFYFNTKAQANKFAKELRAHFIIPERVTEYVVRIFNWKGIKDEYRDSALARAKKIYNEIMK